MGYVYLVEDTGKETYKIGVTKNMKHRISRLQNGNSSELYIISQYFSNYPYRLEKMLHLHFYDKRVLNEWFKLTQEDVKNFTNTCNMISEQINALLENPYFKKNIK